MTTDDQFNQLLDLFTKQADGIERLEKVFAEPIKSSTIESGISKIKNDAAELETNIAKLKQRMARMKRELHITNKTLKFQFGEMTNIRARLEMLEDEKELST